MLWVGSSIISFHCAIQPTVRATANSTVNMRGREAHRLQRDARIEVDVRIELLLDEILVVQRDALELHRDLEQRIVAMAELAQHLVAVFCMILARGS